MKIEFATPFLVNFLIFVPFVLYLFFRKKIYLSGRVLFISLIFSSAFGFVEASVVVYLRSALGIISQNFNPDFFVASIPALLIRTEFLREAATMIMLASLSILAQKKWMERAAVFFWSFAVWDIFYYLSLWFLIGWPQSLLSKDVLFLIPVPWYSQVWFPIIVSLLTMAAIWINKNTARSGIF